MGRMDIKLPITKLICVLYRNIIKAKYRNSITKFGHKFYTSTSWENSNCWLCWYQMLITKFGSLFKSPHYEPTFFFRMLIIISWYQLQKVSSYIFYVLFCTVLQVRLVNVSRGFVVVLIIIVVVIIIFFLYNYYRCNFWRKRIMCSFFNFLFLS